MTKTDLIDKVAKDTKLTKKDSDQVIGAIINAITGALAKSDKVTLVSFGSFEVRKRAARQGRNPQTGKAISIPARKAPVFRAGKGLKDAVGKK